MMIFNSCEMGGVCQMSVLCQLTCQLKGFIAKTTLQLIIRQLNQMQTFWHKICFYIVMKTIN